MNDKLEIVPITQKAANLFVKNHHRHHKEVRGSVFQIGCSKNGELVGVVIVGRPVSRVLQDGKTLEVNRMCSIGEKNVCSKLYAAAWRAAKELGWKRLITYILDEENGVSLCAAGWKCIGQRGGGSWNTACRKRTDKHPTQKKKLFEAA
jgi:hypothetical protein